ncbi:Peptidase C10, streptopain, partial [Candidatus Magnetomorum sp. HK-1]
MAQIMKYWGHPSQGIGAHSYDSNSYGTLYANFTTTYPWGNMYNTTANDAVKTLLYHCGVSVNMEYGPKASSANAKLETPKALVNYFKYDASIFSAERADYSNQDWIQLLRQEITEKRPVLYYGRDVNSMNGHAFICDGYQTNNYFHFNWGWSGNYDGYYSLDGMQPDQSSNFNYEQGAVLGIKPVDVVNLVYPYEENFEDETIPEPWIVKGSHAYIGLKESLSGVRSLLLNDYTTTETGVSLAQLKINVPNEGATLRFYVKRGYSPQPSDYNHHKAEIRPEFGDTVLHSFFNGDFNDLEWQEFFLDLTPWKSQTVTLYFEQNNESDTFRQWMAIDDVIIKQEPVANFYANKTLIYEGQTVQFTNTSTMAESYLWQFGDNTISQEAHPVHKYNNTGIYTITLSVNNDHSSMIKQSYIHVLPRYIPPYTLENGGDFESHFDDFASGFLSGSINLWESGIPGNIFNVAHSGSRVWKTGLSKNIEKGDYTCILITPLFDLSASGTYAIQFYQQMDIHYNNCPGAAWLEYTTDEGQSWQRLGTYENNPSGSKNWYNKETHDASPNGPCWWQTISWTCSRLMIPQLVGKKAVGFRFVYRVESQWGNDLTYLIDGWCIDDFEIQYTPPTAAFEHPKLAYVGQPVQFTDQSISAFSWKWSFGDHSSETLQNPVHTYSAPGYYSISLEINNGVHISTHDNGIHVLPDRGIPYSTGKGGNFDTRTDDFDSQSIVGSINLWEHGKTENALLPLQSNSMVWKTRLNDTIPKAQFQCALYTPNFITTQSGTYSLNFEMSMDVTYANGPFAAQCQYSTNNGQSWFRLGEDNDSFGENWYNRGPSSDYKINTSIFNDQMGWTAIINNQPVSYRITLDSSVSQIAFRFVLSVTDNFTDGYNNDGFMIDNFFLTGPPSG